jgi:hypothetical protein
MTLTTEQRSEINRRNGQKSQGPKTDEGKALVQNNCSSQLPFSVRGSIL